jgi:hypothetical protein
MQLHIAMITSNEHELQKMSRCSTCWVICPTREPIKVCLMVICCKILRECMFGLNIYLIIACIIQRCYALVIRFFITKSPWGRASEGDCLGV